MSISSFTDANLAIATAYADLKAAIPEKGDAIDAIVSAVVPPEKVSNFFEFAYANGDKLPASLRTVAADVGDFAWTNAFYGLGENQRGMKMAAALRASTFSIGANDPEPKAEYADPQTPVAVQGAPAPEAPAPDAPAE